ncbi:MAG: ADP-ribosylglycohydrolase family protein [Chloroflexota bacterium]
MASTLEDKIYGCLLGGLIGDAMGAPTEGKTYQQIQERFGPSGVTDFEGVGTDDTAIREQLIDAIFKAGGDVTCDHFAQSFIDHRARNYRLWFIPVRNAFHKFDAGLRLPAYAGWDNMQSSSTAMSISPMGIINACDPRRAALETLDVASVIHNGASGFCRDAACAMAAAVAAAFRVDATPASVVAAATAHLLPVSAREMRERIRETLALADETGDYEAFRATYYERHRYPTASDSRETVPATFALFTLAGGDPERAILYGANFGRDADTIATMVGGLAGALHGAAGLPWRWVEKVEANPDVRYRELVAGLADIVRRRAAGAEAYASAIAALG